MSYGKNSLLKNKRHNSKRRGRHKEERLTPEDSNFIKDAVLSLYSNSLAAFYDEATETAKSLKYKGFRQPKDVETVDSAFANAFSGKRSLPKIYRLVLEELTGITRDTLPSKNKLIQTIPSNKDIASTEEAKYYFPSIDELTKRFQSAQNLANSHEPSQSSAGTNNGTEYIRLIVNKIVYDSSIVEFANFFKLPLGEPDARPKIMAILNKDARLRYELAKNIVNSNGMDVIYWADNSFDWTSKFKKHPLPDSTQGFTVYTDAVDSYRETLSQVESVMIKASQQSCFLERYQCFGLEEYCQIIQSFAFLECYKAVRMFTHMCFKNGGECLREPSRNGLRRLLNITQVKGFFNYLKECNSDVQVLYFITVASEEGVDAFFEKNRVVL